jgi:hypothetical protein
VVDLNPEIMPIIFPRYVELSPDGRLHLGREQNILHATPHLL